MALTGELTDLSLAELIEFFCNQRKTGRLEVVYPSGPGYFYLQSGSVVHATIGILRGIEAVYYALTVANASFKFSSAAEAPEHSINQPWTSVVLEGLRRMDEGISPANPFPEIADSPIEKVNAVEHHVEERHNATAIAPHSPIEKINAVEYSDEVVDTTPAIPAQREEPFELPRSHVQPQKEDFAFLSQIESRPHFADRPWKLSVVTAAIALLVVVIAVPWGWYARARVAKLNSEAKTLAPVNVQASAPAVAISTESPATTEATEPTANPEATASAVNPEAAELAKRQREARAKEEARVKAKSPETAVTTLATQPTSSAVAPKTEVTPASGSKRVTVQVTYDENGRVTQASGGDATALRIARQKRFPAGKAGSATITIPIN